MRPATDAEQWLAGWLERLVALLLAHGGAAARQLLATVVDRQAVLRLDDARLALSATRAADGTGLVLQLAPAAADAPAHLQTRGDVLREVIDGRALLDTVITDGRLDLRGALPDLLGLHELVMIALALGARSAALRALWAEFDATWPRGAPADGAIDRQAAVHGRLVHSVPESVRHARSPWVERAQDQPSPDSQA